MTNLSTLIDYPSLANVEKLNEMFVAIQKAAVPNKFTYRFFARLGFTSSNDRGFVPLLEFLGFIDADSRPTEYYLRMRDKDDFPVVLEELVKRAYIEIFNIDPSIALAPEHEVVNIFNRLTGKDEKDVLQCVLTFEAVLNLTQKPQNKSNPVSEGVSLPTFSPAASSTKTSNSLTLNLTINLPESTNPAVYNAIFKSIKENLQ